MAAEVLRALGTQNHRVSPHKLWREAAKGNTALTAAEVEAGKSQHLAEPQNLSLQNASGTVSATQGALVRPGSHNKTPQTGWSKQ